MDVKGLQQLKELLVQAIRKIEILIDLSNDWPLMPKQELFCQLYATDREFFGNGVQAYIEAYDINTNKPGAYAGAQASASRLLTNVMILKRIDELLEAGSLNDVHVDKQLGFWLTQKAHPQAALAAIKEYNALKQRITKKLDVTSGGQPIPILGGASVPTNESTPADSPPPQTN